MQTTHRLSALYAAATLALSSCASSPAAVELSQGTRRPLQFSQRAVAPAFAPVTPAQHAFTPADLDSYLSQGLEHHPLILAARADWQASHERAAQVTAWPEPKLRYSEFLESVEQLAAPQPPPAPTSAVSPSPRRFPSPADGPRPGVCRRVAPWQ